MLHLSWYCCFYFLIITVAQLLSNQESRNHSMNTSSRKGFKCKRFYRGLGRAGGAKGGKESACGGARRRKEFVTQRWGSCLWAEPRKLTQALWAGCSRRSLIAAVPQEPEAALRWCWGPTVCGCLQSFPVALYCCCRQTQSRKKALCVSSYHQSPALDRT